MTDPGGVELRRLAHLDCADSAWISNLRDMFWTRGYAMKRHLIILPPPLIVPAPPYACKTLQTHVCLSKSAQSPSGACPIALVLCTLKHVWLPHR